MKKIIVVFSVMLLVGIVSCGGGKNIKDSDKNADGFSLDEKYNEKAPNRGRAEGVAAIFDNDKALARDRAINDARNKLVEKILGTTVSGQSIMRDFELVKMIVEAKSYGLVKNETIIKEKSDAEMYTVELEGTVEPAVIEDAIRDALNRYGRPKFIVLVNESFEGRQSMPGYTATEIIMQDLMGNLGFEFVDAQTTRELMKTERAKMQKAMSGSISEDVQQLLLNSVGAEVVIFGVALTDDQTHVLESQFGTTNMKSKRASVTLKAVDVYSARILATKVVEAGGVDISPQVASKKAVENALKRKDALGSDKNAPGTFIDTIMKKFVESATHRQINILITGLDYNGLKKFRNEVENRIRGVQQVLDKGRIGRAARIEVYFAGTTNEFIDELKAKSEKLGFQIDIPENFPNKVILEARLLNGK
ncbi:MAG: hypothetical protein A2176_14620 [Spirochaetes bacterium RBG_13_51_14]|nr:MAG: hypothetical protein A2176_14620 [Spirochaetes bacterium RBG_13_51_14]